MITDNKKHAKEEKKYEVLSPFELKDKLADLATRNHADIMINAGRGNPNWIATAPREAYFLFGQFAIKEGLRIMSRPGMAGEPEVKGSGDRLITFCDTRSETKGAEFLFNAYKYVTETLNLDGDSFVGEMADAILGDHYPMPDRVLKNTEKVVQAYIKEAMCNGEPPEGTMDMFLTEGGTAAMTYIFNTLKENNLLNPGDKIAIGTPIFSPYLEIPPLEDYQLETVYLKMDESIGWQYPDSELEKLKDPSIKAFFLVNPSNPPSISISEQTLQKIADLVKNERKDLIILTDDVYSSFVNGFKSLAAIAPKNTILVYSYSKYFGCTGWRMGVIGMYQDNVLDEMIAAQPENIKEAQFKRYESIATNPAGIKLIDRMVADSRAVALNHTAGLSTPQQVMMVFFSLAELMDCEFHLYKREAQAIVSERYRALYEGIGIPAPDVDNTYAHYYTTIDINLLAEERYGKEFDKWLRDEHEPIDFVWRLAEIKDVVLMDGGGFAAPDMSVRVSLANLHTPEYTVIGKAISELLADYKQTWDAKK